MRYGVFGQSILDVRGHDSDGKILIPDSLELWVDAAGTLGIEEVKSRDFQWADSIAEINIPQGAALWAIWHLTNSGKDRSNLVLGTGEGDAVDVNWVSANKISHQKSGSRNQLASISLRRP